MNRVQPSAENFRGGLLQYPSCLIKYTLGKIGETISEKWLETADFRQKTGFQGYFSES